MLSDEINDQSMTFDINRFDHAHLSKLDENLWKTILFPFDRS
jgi:hypothetical protein